MTCSEEEEYDYRYDDDIYFAFRYDSLLYEDDYIGFRLYLSTKEIFGCVNYYIVTDEEYGSNKIDIHILDVDIGDICLTALGPANKQIPMSFDSDSYELVFHNSTETNSHQINILNDSISVVIGDTSFAIYNQERAIYP